MSDFDWKKMVSNFDARRDLLIPGNKEQTIDFCVKQLIQIGQEAIHLRGSFFLALSGGSTPNAIFKKVGQSPYKEELDWSKVYLFWSDERSVPPIDKENNYYNGMQAGLSLLPIPSTNIYRMQAEENIEENALAYEKLIKQKVPHNSFDLVMLGMGEDGHTASLFPETHGLHTNDRLVIANYVPQKSTWRMSLTYECIHLAKQIIIYVLGKEKAFTVKQVLTEKEQPNHYPIQRIGTPTQKALWVLDSSASHELLLSID